MTAALRASVPVTAVQSACDGHFPDDPLVPAVILLQWLWWMLPVRGPSFRVQRASFTQAVRPNSRVELTTEDRGAYFDCQVFSDGMTAARVRLVPIATEQWPDVPCVPHSPASAPAPDAWLRHRGDALLIDSISGLGDDWLSARSTTRERGWPWWLLLEGAAQTAGLRVGFGPSRMARARVVAGFQGVRFRSAHTSAESVTWFARERREVLGLRQLEVRAVAGDRVLLDGTVVLAPAP